MSELMRNIVAEPAELKRSLGYTLGQGRSALDAAAKIVNEGGPLYITGIGSSWHAGMALLSFFQAAGRPAQLIDASEILYFARIPQGSTLLVLSRSGKSVEIVRLLEVAKASAARVVAITNTPDSP